MLVSLSMPSETASVPSTSFWRKRFCFFNLYHFRGRITDVALSRGSKHCDHAGLKITNKLMWWRCYHFKDRCRFISVMHGSNASFHRTIDVAFSQTCLAFEILKSLEKITFMSVTTANGRMLISVNLLCWLFLGSLSSLLGKYITIFL